LVWRGFPDMLRAVGEQDVPGEPVPVLVLSPNEMPEIIFAEFSVFVMICLFRLSDPHGGGERSQAGATERSRQRILG